MSSINETLEKLARLQGETEKGFGDFLKTLDALETIERQLEQDLKDSLSVPFSDPMALGKRQAD